MSEFTELLEFLESHKDLIKINHLAIHVQQPAPTVSEQLSAYASGQMGRRRRFWTEEEDQYLRDHYADTLSEEIAEHLNRSIRAVFARAKLFGLKKSKAHLSSLMPAKIGEKTRFQKGQASWNKGKQMPFNENSARTQFKPGNRPQNSLQDGAITIRTDKRGVESYWIRISKAQWEPLKNHIWKKQHGEIPDGYMVAFKDKNPKNCVIENLILLTRKENMLRNSIHNYPEEVKTSIRLLSKLKRKINEHAKQTD